MTAVIPNWPPNPPSAVRHRGRSPRGGKVPGPASPLSRSGPGIPMRYTGTCQCGWDETGTIGDWGRVWAATEKHCRTLRHYPLFRAEPADVSVAAGGGR